MVVLVETNLSLHLLMAMGLLWHLHCCNEPAQMISGA
jgi:hypothetical protein